MTLPKWNDRVEFACALCKSPMAVKFRARNPGAFCRSCMHKVIRKYKEWGSKHRESGTKLYGVWNAMKRRCTKPTDSSYAAYGGRGIYVCELWLQDYRHFSTWARSNGYAEGLYLDRRDNDGPYSPDNCQWQTPKAQTYNKRTRAGHLSVSQANEIRLMVAAGKPFAEIQAKFRITKKVFRRLMSGETFARFLTMRTSA